MDLNVVLVPLAISAVAGCFVTIFRSEWEGLSPRLARGLKQLAMKAVAENLKGRLDEEWQAVLDDMPSPLTKVFAGLGFCFAAVKMNPGFLNGSIVRAGAHAKGLTGAVALGSGTGLTMGLAYVVEGHFHIAFLSIPLGGLGRLAIGPFAIVLALAISLLIFLMMRMTREDAKEVVRRDQADCLSPLAKGELERDQPK